ncbi:DUF1654 domain-containing protein [Pseudomonas sp. LP_7_YM]|uniref:DUF1654 domain-containing protein n=1 Tax=Pseudomonas sp. LP_7_YM TaxID=2485137 RepID=UPI00105B922A|nr:uncharacterized protein DUF1654 [Pseudomonas sp. LP_7_YM]
MLRQPDFTRNKLRTYEQIGHRVHQIITDPQVQKTQCVTISRLPNESPADWLRLLNEIGGTAGIKVEAIEGDAYKVGWREYCEQ